MTIFRLLLFALIVFPVISYGAPNITLPYYTGFESDTVGEDLGDNNCDGLDDGNPSSDCSITFQDTYPARYGDNYLSFECEYSGVRAERQLAMRAGNTTFEGFREGADCAKMHINDGTEYWIGWSNYVPSEYTGEKFSHGLMQIGADNLVDIGGNVVMSQSYGALEKYENEWKTFNRVGNSVIYRHNLADNWQQFKGTWVDSVLHVVWYDTDNINAKLEMYLNGVLEWERNGSRNIGTDGEPIFILCDYNWAFAWALDPDAYMEYPDTAQTRGTYVDEFRFYQQEDGAGDNTYCDVAPPIWGAAPEITYPLDTATAIPTSFTATFDAYSDHRSDGQNCFSYEETTVQIDEYGGDWSSLVFDSTSSASETQMSVSGLSAGTRYQMRVQHTSQRVDSTDEYAEEWEVIGFTTASGSDSTAPTWGSPEGITSATDDGISGTVHVTVKACSDPSTPIVYKTYYAPTSSWSPTFQNNDVWNNSEDGWHISGLTDGTLYTFGITCSDSEGNEASTTVTDTATPSAPSSDGVSGVSGSLVDGNSVVISGSGFGSGPNVVLFDDFEGGTLGENIDTGTDSAKYGDWNARSGSSYYGGASLSGDQSFSSTYANGYTNYIEASLPSSTRGLYLSWWIFLPSGNNYPGEGHIDGINWKQMWIQGGSTTDDDLVVPTRITSWLIDGNDADPGYAKYLTVNFNKGEWKRLSVWLKGSTTSSSEDGELTFWELTDSGTVARVSDTNINLLKETGAWEKVRPNGYGRTTDNCIVSFDDIYIASGDNAQARVEIGNASTYAASTELTILTPTDWDATEITATINVGTFEQYDEGYLYVTDADGVTYPGFPVTFESTQTATTISGSGTNAVTGEGTPAVVGVEPTDPVENYWMDGTDKWCDGTDCWYEGVL